MGKRFSDCATMECKIKTESENVKASFFTWATEHGLETKALIYTLTNNYVDIT